MEIEVIITQAAQLVFGGITAILAILVWSKTRRTSWLMMVIGTIFLFGDLLFSVLVSLGLATYDYLVFFGVSFLEIGLNILPFFFFMLGFAYFLSGSRHY